MTLKQAGFLILCMISIAGCSSPASNEFTARVTFYAASSTKTSTGTPAKQGVTVAVDPKIIPYGSTIEIDELKGVLDDGRFIAEDTGPAVKRRKAAKARGENVPVIDIYISKDRMQKLKRNLPEFMKIRIIKDKPIEKLERLEMRKEESRK